MVSTLLISMIFSLASRALRGRVDWNQRYRKRWKNRLGAVTCDVGCRCDLHGRCPCNATTV